jgi:excisionase family DNA binding protein
VNSGKRSVDRAAYTVNQFCAAHGIGRTTFYAELKAGRIRVVKCGRKTLVPETESDAWLGRLAGEAREVTDA